MPDLYLILHKVRGEPAFDVAYPFRFGDEDGWLIPTSGHRAHPAETWRLDDLDWHLRLPINYNLTEIVGEVPDHYAASEPRVVNGKATREPAFNPRGLLAELGLAKKQTIKVRKIT